MSKTLQTYYLEQLRDIQQLIRKTKKLIGENQLREAIDQLVQYDEYLSEALDLILNKREWSKNERDRQNNVIFVKDYEVKASQIAKAVNNKINDLRAQLAVNNQDFPYKDIVLSTDLSPLYGQAAPYKRLLAVQELLGISRCVCMVQVDLNGITKRGTGLLIKGNYLVTNYQLIPNAEVAASTKISIDFIDQDKQNIQNYTLDKNTWTGDSALNFAKIAIKEPVPSWHLYANGFSTPRGGEPLLFLDNGYADNLQGQISDSRLSQFLDPFLRHDAQAYSISPGTPVFNSDGKIVGLHHGSQAGTNQITSWSAIEHYQELNTEEPTNVPAEPVQLTPSSTEQSPKKVFGYHHKFTCDRVLQNDQFTPYIDVAGQKEQERLHFFYLHGGERQEHVGLFNRFVSRLKGEDKDHIKVANRTGDKVKKIILKFPRSHQLENIKIQLPLDILLAFQLEEKQIEKIEHKCLADALRVENSLINNYQKEDKVCILININESAWNPELTPKAAVWFIEDFCQSNLPAICPEFFIFFAINYDDEDEEEKNEMQAEVQAALDKGKYTQALFPVLDMVEYQDIKDWFEEYAVFWDYDRKRIRQVRTRHFGSDKTPRFMEDVQDILEDIIEEVKQENT